MPERVQRKRRSGEAGIPAGAIYVGRPTIFGNPFKVDSDAKTVYVHDDINVHYRIPGSPDASDLVQERAVALYRSWLECGDIRGLTELPGADLPPILIRKRGQIIGDLHTLAGRDLCCWCPPERSCHASVLLEFANSETSHRDVIGDRERMMMEPLHSRTASVAEERGEAVWPVTNPRCTAEYDQFSNKRCTLPAGHEGRHHAQWEANMLFDHDYRDPAAADWLD